VTAVRSPASIGDLADEQLDRLADLLVTALASAWRRRADSPDRPGPDHTQRPRRDGPPDRPHRGRDRNYGQRTD
jgi:hypothetical protein